MEKWDVVVVIASLVALFIGVITPIVRLNTSITKLNTTMDIFSKKFDKTEDTLCEHGEKIADHETRIQIIEKTPTRKAKA